MGFVDSLAAEDRVQVKFSDFYNLVKGCAQREFIMNAVNTNVPHEYIRMMATGIKESEDENE